MSWSSSSYPPRRSRSRSPPRGSYPPRPPYPDSTYSGDPYRPDWDTYDRDRPWPGYDRDRAAYDYGRRGRSRSPPPEEVGRKRRRSLSPYDRDRYDPRPRYNDDFDAHSRGYGGYSPRRGPPPPPFPGRRAPPDPHTFDYPATLKQYAEWFRYHYPQQAIDEDNADKAAEQEAGDGSKPRNGIKMRWEKYKKEFAAAQLQTMFDHHRKSPWFAEKYDPALEFQNLRTRVRKEGWKGRLNAFLHDLESGRFDPDLNESEPEPTSPIKESVSNGDASKDTNGAAVDDTKGDDDIQFNIDADDEAGDNDASRDVGGKSTNDYKRYNRGEEISVIPEGNQVMIRTIPPDIGRIKLEEACSKIPGFVYLALGDPLQKRNFYRAGWLRFRDDADMAAVMNELSEKKIEGFKLHVTHNQRPFVNRIRFTPEVASRPERMAKDLASVKVLAEILEEEFTQIHAAKVPPLTAPKSEGDETQSTEQADVAMAPPEPEEEPEPLERGCVAVERRIVKVMADLRDQGLDDMSNEKAHEEKKVAVSLDLYLAYLRAAYHTCYYCAVVTDHLEELQRKCIKHVRKPLSVSLREEMRSAEGERKEDESNEKGTEKEKKSSTESRDSKRNDERWLEWLDLKVALLINRDGVDPRDYGGKSYDEELSKAVEAFIKQEDEGKFRCKTCQKLFKATSFVEKHIANKHPDHVKHLEEIPYFNKFALDPHRIQPFSHPPPPTNSNSQAAPPQAYGIQGPPAYHGGEYGRPPYYGGGGGGGGGGGYGPGYPPPYQNGYWDHHGYAGGPYGLPGYAPPPMVPSRRDEATVARRLSDRISGFAPGTDNSNVPATAGLPPKPSAAALDSALSSGVGNRRGKGAQGGPPPPPPDAKEDPRAAAGKRVSYHDMDLVAEGDVELFY